MELSRLETLSVWGEFWKGVLFIDNVGQGKGVSSGKSCVWERATGVVG